jgi:hypothetical protein
MLLSGSVLSSFLLFVLLSSTMSEANKNPAVGVAARLARKNILELQPYRCARDDYSDGVLLDANENAYGPAASENLNELERYPDPHQMPLKEKLVAYRGNGLRPENVFVGVGSDEAIDLLMRIFCRPGQDQILQTPPTYGMYKVCAKVNDVGMINVPLTPDFDLPINEVSKDDSIVLLESSQTCIVVWYGISHVFLPAFCFLLASTCPVDSGRSHT